MICDTCLRITLLLRHSKDLMMHLMRYSVDVFLLAFAEKACRNETLLLYYGHAVCLGL